MFFKVLFVEGGSQPAMFRCKTPIYTSSNAVNPNGKKGRKNAYPTWDDARFRFDMLMPETADGSFKMQGEIIVAVYGVSRSNGSNEMLGQTSVELGNLMKLGSSEQFREGVEGRSVTGGYPCVSRAGKEVGELHFQMNIAWLSSNNITTTNSGAKRPTTATNASRSQAQTQRPSSASVTGGSRVAPRTTAAGVAARTTSASVAPSGATKRPAGAQIGSDGVAKVVVAPARKIVSAISRKQKEDAARIERENRKLTSRLQVHTTKHSVHMEDVYTGKNDVATTNAILSTAAEAKSKFNDDRSRAGSKSGSKGSDYTTEELLKIVQDLKKGNASLESDNAAMRANVNKLSIHVKKYAAQIATIKGRNSFDSASVGGGSVAGSRGQNRTSSAAHSNNTSNMLNAVNRTSRHVSSAPCSAVDTDVEITSQEHQNVADEYGILQSVRRGLVDRIAAAKKSLTSAHGTVHEVQDRQTLLKQRVGYYSMASKCNELMSGNRRYDDKKGVDRDDDEEEDGEQNNSDAFCAPVDPTSEDFLLFERLRTINGEVLRSQYMIEHHLHTLSADSQIAEMTSTCRLLSEQAEKVQQEVDEMQREKSRKQALLQSLMSSDSVMHLRQFVTEMSSTTQTLQRNERLGSLSESFKTIELELLRLKLRQKERKEHESSSS
eukprot:gene28787-35708_t